MSLTIFALSFNLDNKGYFFISFKIYCKWLIIKIKYTKMQIFDNVIDKGFGKYDIKYRVHATRRMFQRNITEEDIESLLREGIIIEKYDDDFPLPSILISGSTLTNRPLHLVAGINIVEKTIVIITVYEPDPFIWSDSFTRRIK